MFLSFRLRNLDLRCFLLINGLLYEYILNFLHNCVGFKGRYLHDQQELTMVAFLSRTPIIPKLQNCTNTPFSFKNDLNSKLV